jgi:hypothetical protein
MDELELLKQQWQNREQELPKLSYEDIYKMLLKKSSSIVKWIFYISVAELIFWTLLSLFVPESSKKFSDNIGLHNVLIVLNILSHIIVISFVILFYKNYRKISTTDSVKNLMKNILRTRKTVKYFVFYNVGASILMIIGLNIYYYLNQDTIYDMMIRDYGISTKITQEKFVQVFFVVQFVFGLIMVGVMLLFYRLVYGTLLRRLHKNYKELEKLEL